MTRATSLFLMRSTIFGRPSPALYIVPVIIPFLTISCAVPEVAIILNPSSINPLTIGMILNLFDNVISNKLTNLYNRYSKMTTPSFNSLEDNKFYYPKEIEEFHEETIYRTIIKYCNFNTE